MDLSYISKLVLFFAYVTPTECISCYSCSGIARVADCNKTITCNSDEVCFHEKIAGNLGHTYNIGCRNKQLCQSNSISFVGKRYLMHDVTTLNNCSDCCETELCNKGLCWNETSCMDTHDLDCSTVNVLLDVCNEPAKAKSTCRLFCGLCDIVDGEFTSWSPWSSCDVTCDNGTQIRTRTCTNPTPKNGGDNCAGSSTDKKACQLSKCPVHGHWSDWNSWGSCSVSCGPGFQRRDRTCSNPFPSVDGNWCFGDARDDRLCPTKACADGGWSTWSAWSPCSASCGNGFKTRTRDCTYPSPSVYGKPCAGQSMDIEACNNNRCADSMSSFSVDQPKSLVKDFLTFYNVISNVGNDFNSSTGIFTCSKPGVYVFSFILVKKRGPSRVDSINCYLHKNNVAIIRGSVDPTDDATDYGSAYAGNTAIIHLKKGDKVGLYSCYDPSSTMESWTSFSGFLLNPDVL